MAGTGTFAEIIDGDVFYYYAHGQWNKSSSGKFVPIINPTTRKTHFKVQGTKIDFVNSKYHAFKHLYVTILFEKVYD